MREAIETVKSGDRPPNVLAADADAKYPHLVVVKTVIEQQTQLLPV